MHGAGLGGFIWKEVIKNLPYRCLAVDLPNRGNATSGTDMLDLESYCKHVLSQIQAWKRGKIYVVAHSIAGCLALQMHAALAEDLKGLIAVGAAIPRSGQSFCECMPFPQSLLLPLILRLFGTKPTDKMIETQLCHDLSRSQKRQIVDHFTPESRGLYTDKVTYSQTMPKAMYVKLTNDQAIPPALQDKMIRNLQSREIQTMDTGHLPMLGRPFELAKIITEYVQT